MSKLMDICGLVNYDKKTRQHDKSKSVYGSILVDELSDYFEGFVRTYDESNSFLVFGTCNKEEGFHMYSVNESMEQPEETIEYAPSIDEISENSRKKQYSRFVTPNMRIIIQDGDMFRDVTNGEISLLQAKIDLMKEKCNLNQSKINK